MNSGKKIQQVTELVRVCSNWFAVTRDGERVRIRKLDKPKARALPASGVSWIKRGE